MNERFWEIVEQADEQGGDDPDIRDQVFAELIVKECMDLALAEQKRYANITHRDMNECAVALGNFSLLMKDHFEGEE